jgi:hypothetical protein
LRREAGWKSIGIAIYSLLELSGALCSAVENRFVKPGEEIGSPANREEWCRSAAYSKFGRRVRRFSEHEANVFCQFRTSGPSFQSESVPCPNFLGHEAESLSRWGSPRTVESIHQVSVYRTIHRFVYQMSLYTFASVGSCRSGSTYEGRHRAECGQSGGLGVDRPGGPCRGHSRGGIADDVRDGPVWNRHAGRPRDDTRVEQFGEVGCRGHTSEYGADIVGSSLCVSRYVLTTVGTSSAS